MWRGHRLLCQIRYEFFCNTRFGTVPISKHNRLKLEQKSIDERRKACFVASSSSIGRTHRRGDNFKGNGHMASVPGGQYTFFANGGNTNVVATPDGSHLPPPVAGEFNLELLTSGHGSAAIPPGYQGVAMLSPDGRTLDMVAGDYGVHVGHGGPHTIIAGTGNDTIYGGNGPTMIIGGSGNDQIYGGNGRDPIVGGSGGELVVGGNGKDTIVGGSGPDTIFAGHGGALIVGGSGATSIFAGDGRDTIIGGSGPTQIYGGLGHATITGGSGPTTIYGGSGRDVITAGSGSTLVVGGDGKDTITGGSGPDTIFAGHGGDLILGGSGKPVRRAPVMRRSIPAVLRTRAAPLSLRRASTSRSPRPAR